MMTTNYTVSFKDTLFETVSLEPWPLAYKMIFTEVRMDLTEALQDLHNWYTAVHTTRLLEAETSWEQTLTRFKALPALSPDHVIKLKAQVDNPDSPPPGIINKFFRPIKKGLDRINKTVNFPRVDDKIQNVIVKLKAKHPDNPAWQNALGWALRLTRKMGWVPSVLLLALGTIATLASMPLLGKSVVFAGIALGILRMVADLVNGKSVTYAIGKAITLAATGALIGKGVKEFGVDKMITDLWEKIRPTAEAATTATPPAQINMDDAPTAPAAEPAAPAAEPAAPETAPTPADTGGADGLTPPSPTSPVAYTVRPGDDLGTIAQRHDVTVADIMAANTDNAALQRNPHLIRAGLQLNLPPAQVPPPDIWKGFNFNRYPRG